MELPVETVVQAVTVYPDRARVTLAGESSLSAGAYTLVIGDLPLAMIPESVRATGQGEAEVMLRSVDVRRRHYAFAPSEKVSELEQAIVEVEAGLAALEDRKATTLAQLGYLDGMRGETAAFAKGLAKGSTSIEEQTALLAFLREQETALRTALRELDSEMRALNRRLEQLQAELAELHSAQSRERYEVRLDVEVAEGGAFEVDLSYVVGQSRWQPLYDIRLRDPLDDSGSATLAVTAQAEVSQNTGQDWVGVRLTLSTARPAVNQRAPELHPWYIDEPRPMPRAAKNALMAPASADMVAFESAPLAARRAATVQMATTEQNGAVVSFVVSGESNVPGDGAPHKTTVAQFDLTPEMDYLAVPRHTTTTFRRATVTNTTDGPWLPGSVSLFAGDEFIGSNRLAYTAVGGEVKLFLGAEERIEIERELVQRDVDKRLLRDVRQIQYTYETRVKNLLPAKARVTVQDNYPVSQHDQIKVKLDEVRPRPSEQTEMHMLEWELPMVPQQETTIVLQYSVEHPRDLTVAGLVD